MSQQAEIVEPIAPAQIYPVERARIESKVESPVTLPDLSHTPNFGVFDLPTPQRFLGNPNMAVVQAAMFQMPTGDLITIPSQVQFKMTNELGESGVLTAGIMYNGHIKTGVEMVEMGYGKRHGESLGALKASRMEKHRDAHLDNEIPFIVHWNPDADSFLQDIHPDNPILTISMSLIDLKMKKATDVNSYNLINFRQFIPRRKIKGGSVNGNEPNFFLDFGSLATNASGRSDNMRPGFYEDKEGDRVRFSASKINSAAFLGIGHIVRNWMTAVLKGHTNDTFLGAIVQRDLSVALARMRAPLLPLTASKQPVENRLQVELSKLPSLQSEIRLSPEYWLGANYIQKLPENFVGDPFSQLNTIIVPIGTWGPQFSDLISEGLTKVAPIEG